MTATTVPAANGSFVHEALFYRDRDDYLGGTLPFIRGGTGADEPVLVAVPAPNLRLIGDALGPDGDGVRFIDMAEAGRNPGRIIPGVLHAFLAPIRAPASESSGSRSGRAGPMRRTRPACNTRH